ncbi:permease [Halostagnicola larsenii XH-48]|uniref:Permease n=1 Tax=Halostagnicola larsenii XH-48 TaxID=797299 RepID=W0JQH1_9EURY|nr:hypothetical protein [Halostagnicola larsenii]AHF99414.1 permease [Halostagnicola larsenii XH-48]
MVARGDSDGYLFDLYRQYIGEPSGRNDVYVGFGLFFGGIGLAVTALVLFIWASTHEPRSAAYVTWTEPAYGFGMLSLPAMMLGIVVLLPSNRRMLYTSLMGAAVTFGAVLGFFYAYPSDWNGHGQNYTVEVVAIYAVGIAGLIASTGGALIAHYLELAQSAGVTETRDGDEQAGSESYTDEEIQQDIDDAMEDVELSWGGVEKGDNTKLNFSSHEFDNVEIGDTATTTRSSGVDSQVAGLKGLKGGETKTTTSSSSVEDQTAKLKELREQKRAEEMATNDSNGALDTVASSLRSAAHRVRSLFGRK